MRFLLPVAVLAMLLSVAGCTADTTPHLTFAVHLSVGAGDEMVVVGEVRNAGYAPLRSPGVLESVLQVHDEAGALVACAPVPELTASVLPGGSDFPLRWQGRLEPGSYELTWSAPAHGGIRTRFALVESENGLRLERGATTGLQGGVVLTACDAAVSRPPDRAQ